MEPNIGIFYYNQDGGDVSRLNSLINSLSKQDLAYLTSRCYALKDYIERRNHFTTNQILQHYQVTTLCAIIGVFNKAGYKDYID